METVGSFLIMCSIFYGMKGKTQTVTLKKVFRTIIFWVMSLECQLVWKFHKTIKNVILMDSLLIAVYWIAL